NGIDTAVGQLGIRDDDVPSGCFGGAPRHRAVGRSVVPGLDESTRNDLPTVPGGTLGGPALDVSGARCDVRADHALVVDACDDLVDVVDACGGGCDLHPEGARNHAGERGHDHREHD